MECAHGSLLASIRVICTDGGSEACWTLWGQGSWALPNQRGGSVVQEQHQEPRVLCTDGEAAGGQVLPGCSSQGRCICSKPWQGSASQLM